MSDGFWANKGIVQTTSLGDVHSKPVHTIRNGKSTCKITRKDKEAKAAVDHLFRKRASYDMAA